MIGLILLIAYSLYTQRKTPHFKNMLILSIITLILGVISTIYMNEMVLWILCINMVLQFIYFTYHHKISWVSLLLQIGVLLVLSTLENEFVLLLYFVSIRYHDDTLLDTYETSNTRYQNKLLKNQVDEVQNIYMTMRGWRHDYHNHLQSLKAKLTKNQIDESIEYLNELEKDLDDIHQIVETGNINIDAILNSKLSLAMTHDIDVNVKVSIPTNLPINNIDCCVLLGNLIDNAIKFSHDNSTITIETTDRNGKIYISIKDRGIGIPKKSIGKIWDRFYKSDLSRGKDKKGTGLGLAIVKEVILAHSENINVISTEGVGTEFIFSLMKGTKKEEP